MDHRDLLGHDMMSAIRLHAPSIIIVCSLSDRASEHLF